VGRYVIMPDHVHLFVRGSQVFRLGPWVGLLKQALEKAAGLSLAKEAALGGRIFGSRFTKR
jgi:hypothetical protein